MELWRFILNVTLGKSLPLLGLKFPSSIKTEEEPDGQWDPFHLSHSKKQTNKKTSRGDNEVMKSLSGFLIPLVYFTGPRRLLGMNLEFRREIR